MRYIMKRQLQLVRCICHFIFSMLFCKDRIAGKSEAVGNLCLLYVLCDFIRTLHVASVLVTDYDAFYGDYDGTEFKIFICEYDRRNAFNLGNDFCTDF